MQSSLTWNAKWSFEWDFTTVAAYASNMLWVVLVTQDRLYLIKYNCITDKSLSTHPFKRKEEILLSFGLQPTIWLPVG